MYAYEITKKPRKKERSVYRRKEFLAFCRWLRLPYPLRGASFSTLKLYGIKGPKKLQLFHIATQEEFAAKYNIHDMGTLTRWKRKIKSENLAPEEEMDFGRLVPPEIKDALFVLYRDHISSNGVELFQRLYLEERLPTIKRERYYKYTLQLYKKVLTYLNRSRKRGYHRPRLSIKEDLRRSSSTPHHTAMTEMERKVLGRIVAGWEEPFDDVVPVGSRRQRPYKVARKIIKPEPRYRRKQKTPAPTVKEPEPPWPMFEDSRLGILKKQKDQWIRDVSRGPRPGGR